MSSLITFCPSCGRDLNSFSGADAGCPQCAPVAEPPVPAPEAQPWGMLAALLTWLASVALTLIVPLIGVGIYILVFDRAALTSLSAKHLTLGTGLVSIGGTFIAHLLILGLCWAVVTGLGQREFLSTLS